MSIEERVRALLNSGLSPAAAASIAASEAAQEPSDAGGSSFPLTADVSADDHKITDLADPTNDQDAATKKYVDDNAGGAVLTASVDLSSAQILDLNASPVQLAASPGAGKMHVVLGAVLQRHGGTTPYTGATARIVVGALAAALQDYVTWETMQGPAVLLNGTDVWIAVLTDQNSGANNIVPTDLLENQPLVVGNPNADLEDGDYSLKVTVFYAVVDLL